MARGNDGNYLQHSVEAVLAKQLLGIGNGKLHFNSTHGMAPFERCEEPGNNVQKANLDSALGKSAQPATPGESEVVSAYRTVQASRKHYPNSGELLAGLAGRGCLTGGITETDPTKFASLETTWAGSGVRTVRKSWRNQLGPDGVHRCPSGLSRPWLFSMDPMKYSPTKYRDGDQIYKEDRDRICTTLTTFVQSKRPGAACIFAYTMHLVHRPVFWQFAGSLATATGMTPTYLWMPYMGGNRSLAAILLQGVSTPVSWPPPGIRVGSE
jgi:hypothetical protein